MRSRIAIHPFLELLKVEQIQASDDASDQKQRRRYEAVRDYFRGTKGVEDVVKAWHDAGRLGGEELNHELARAERIRAYLELLRFQDAAPANERTSQLSIEEDPVTIRLDCLRKALDAHLSAIEEGGETPLRVMTEWLIREVRACEYQVNKDSQERIRIVQSHIDSLKKVEASLAEDSATYQLDKNALAASLIESELELQRLLQGKSETASRGREEFAELLQKRLAIWQRWASDTSSQFKNQSITFPQIIYVLQGERDARLEMCKTQAERIQALKTYYSRVCTIADLVLDLARRQRRGGEPTSTSYAKQEKTMAFVELLQAYLLSPGDERGKGRATNP